MRGIVRVLVPAVVIFSPVAMAAPCSRQQDMIACQDGRTGIFRGDAITWADGSTSRLVPRPGVHVGRDGSVHVGPGVFIGDGRGGMQPLDDPTSADSARCAVIDGLSYCY